MSYEIFRKSKIGTVKTLKIENGLIRFIKSSTHHWFIEFAMNNQDPFVYTNFSTTTTEIEASCLFDFYYK